MYSKKTAATRNGITMLCSIPLKSPLWFAYYKDNGYQSFVVADSINNQRAYMILAILLEPDVQWLATYCRIVVAKLSRPAAALVFLCN